MTYYLENKLSAWRSDIVVVGCGGTGGHVAEGLCRLLLDQPDIPLVLIDHDRVEEHNLVRQSFYREDLGRFKAEALAERLARKFGRPVAYALDPVVPPRRWYQEGRFQHIALGIGCVDNPMARQAIAAHVGPDMWWVDAGNGQDFGQVLVGNARASQMPGAFDAAVRVCRGLPLPALVQPDLVAPEPPIRTSRDCAQAMAALVLEVVRRLLAGTCIWWQVYLDLGQGSLRTVEVTPEAVFKITGVSERRLVDAGKRAA